jgi:quercetin dioxygenase-like cupin family protein
MNAQLLAILLLFWLAPVATAATPASNRVQTVLTTPLPPHMQGNTLRATVITVNYGPGESSPLHMHACPVIVYVLEGRIRSKVGGLPEAIYSGGESFYEPPGAHHEVSANASKDKPARFLAFFVCDRDTPLSTNLTKSGDGAETSKGAEK